MAAGFLIPLSTVGAHQLASVIRNRTENVLIIDCRSFIEHNACHIATAVNVCCSKIVKRRLLQDKLSVKELLLHTCNCEVDEKLDVVVYDQSSKDADNLPSDSFVIILLKKLQLAFRSVTLLAGGFDAFNDNYPDLCDDKTRRCPPLTSLSQPCLPIANQGATRILPFLYLGSQIDALNKEMLNDHNISYQLNVSTACPQPEFVQEGHFMRIPVNDNYSEKLLPFFPEAFNFLDKVREGSGCVLIHCLAGISRSPTVAIAYVMRYLRFTSDDGYRYVKSKRPTISPNFNFLGQLLEYEKQLRKENILDAKPEVTSAPPLYSQKRLCRTDMRTSKLSLAIETKANENSNIFAQPRSGDQSPTTALANLSFGGKELETSTEEVNQPGIDFRQYRSKSCYGDWLRDREDSTVELKARECNVATTSKFLSPVKEIKCESLISEISTSQGGISFKSREVARQRTRRGSEESQLCSSSKFATEKPVFSSTREDKFYPPTHAPLPFKSNTPIIHVRSKNSEQNRNFKTSSFVDSQNSPSEAEANKRSTLNRRYFSEASNKRARHTSLDRSGNLLLKKEKSHSHFLFRENPTQYKSVSFLPSFIFKAESRNTSDTVSTSGLEDDVLRNCGSQCISSAGTSSASVSDYSIETECDSGVPPWIWPKKKVPAFDTSHLNIGNISAYGDKCKYQPLIELCTFDKLKNKELLLLTCNKNLPNQFGNSRSNSHSTYPSFTSDSKFGLHRVQSCPEILNSISLLSTLECQSKCTFSWQKKEESYSNAEFRNHRLSLNEGFSNGKQKINNCCESCPDVSNFEDFEKNSVAILHQQRQREFRRNVRIIQVS